MKMNSYWNWSLRIILHQRLTTSAQMFRIFQQEGLVFSTSLPLLFSPFFSPLSGGWSCADSGAIQYLYVSFCLVSTARGGGLSCVWFATAAIQFQLLKRWGPFWTKPSVWVGRFIKWQTGSLYLANVSRGRCVCVRLVERQTREERER